MQERIPTLIFFTQAYWNQLGPDVYGSIQKALGQFIMDGGEEIKTKIRGELMSIYGSESYCDWFKAARTNQEIIRLVGGRFILPEEIPILLQELEKYGSAAS